MRRAEIDELLYDAVDMHVHGYPEITFDCEMRLSDMETLQVAKDYGMRGIVFKSHLWPTMASVYHMKQRISEIEIYPSITLNVSAGGISAWAVEAAAKQGARVVWMPTWSSRNGSSSRLLRQYLDNMDTFDPSSAIEILDDNGKLKQNVGEVIEVVKQFDLPLFTGHISIQESLALVREARAMGLEKVVLDHPDSRSVHASDEQVVEFAKAGGIVEFTALGTMPAEQRIHPKKICELIGLIGAEHAILDTDSFFDFTAPAPEMLRMLVASLLRFGISKDEITQMVKINPHYLLGLKSKKE